MARFYDGFTGKYVRRGDYPCKCSRNSLKRELRSRGYDIRRKRGFMPKFSWRDLLKVAGGAVVGYLLQWLPLLK